MTRPGPTILLAVAALVALVAIAISLVLAGRAPGAVDAPRSNEPAPQKVEKGAEVDKGAEKKPEAPPSGATRRFDFVDRSNAR